MNSAEEEKSQDKGDPGLKQVYTPGWFSMRYKELSCTVEHLQVQARLSCTKCGNEAHANKNTCPATGRRCLKCGRPNHFAHMCKGVATDKKDKQANAHTLDIKKSSF